MNWLNLLFKSRIPEIIKQLHNIRKELDLAQKRLELVVALSENRRRLNDQVIESAFNDFGMAIWIKDLESRFIFANKNCCDSILKCSPEDAMDKRDDEIDENSLSATCLRSDRQVMAMQETKRFIEHGLYDGEHIFLDTIKSPVFFKGELIGTAGSGSEITRMVSKELENLHPDACSVEIPINAILCKEEVKKILAPGECK